MMRRDAAAEAVAAGLVVEEAKPVGGAIYLPAANIRNVLVLNFPEAELVTITSERIPADGAKPEASPVAVESPADTTDPQPVTPAAGSIGTAAQQVLAWLSA